jgi:hypothetical protein
MDCTVIKGRLPYLVNGAEIAGMLDTGGGAERQHLNWVEILSGREYRKRGKK